jgi:hypothetical protein
MHCALFFIATRRPARFAFRGSSGLRLIRGEATLSPARREDIPHSSVGRSLKKGAGNRCPCRPEVDRSVRGPPEPMWPAAAVAAALLPSRRFRATWKAPVRSVRLERNSRKFCQPVRRIRYALEDSASLACAPSHAWSACKHIRAPPCLFCRRRPVSALIYRRPRTLSDQRWIGAGCRIRTRDLRFTKPLHYHCAKPAIRGDYNRAGGASGSASADRSVPGRDSTWVSGGASRSAAGGLAGLESCGGEDSLEETPTATPMISTTSADKVQERRSESSRLCMGRLSAVGGFPHYDRDHNLPELPPNDASAL